MTITFVGPLPTIPWHYKLWVAAIAQWIRLRLPSCCPGFESQAHHLCFSIYIVQTVYLSIEFECEKNENKQKRGRDWPSFLKKNFHSFFSILIPGRRAGTHADVVSDPPVLHSKFGRLEEATKRPRKHHDRPQSDRSSHTDVDTRLNPDPTRRGWGLGGHGRPLVGRRRAGERTRVKLSDIYRNAFKTHKKFVTFEFMF